MTVPNLVISDALKTLVPTDDLDNFGRPRAVLTSRLACFDLYKFLSHPLLLLRLSGVGGPLII